MNKIKLSLGMLLVGTAFLAGNFVACKSSPATGGAGSGGAGSGGGGSGVVDSGTSATLMDGACAVNAYAHGTPPVCACQDGVPTVCAGTCVDTKVDPDNCGTCGNKCGATSACAVGVCGPVATAVLPAVAGCMALTLAVGGGAVYYADEGHGTINRVGGAAALATGEMGPTWLAVNGTNLFWYNKGTKKIRKVAAAGGTAADVYTNTAAGADGGAAPDVGSFLVTPDGANIYVALGVDVLELPVATGTPVTTVVHEFKGGLPGAMALNGTTNIVFPTGLNVDVDAPLLNKMPAICGDDTGPTGEADMTTCPRLGRSQGSLLMTFMAVLNGRAFWVSESEVRSEKITAMGTTYDPVSMATNNITAAAASTDTIYFGSADITAPMTSGVIQKAPAAVNTNSALPTALARGQASPTSMAVDATKVYWSASDCTISSLAK
jgi:hypothetical protein